MCSVDSNRHVSATWPALWRVLTWKHNRPILSISQFTQIPDLEPAEVNFWVPYAPPRCLPHPSRPSRAAGDRRSLRIWVGRGGSGVCLRGDSAVLSVIAIGVGFLVSGGLTPDCLLPIDVSIQVGVAFGGARSHTTEPEPGHNKTPIKPPPTTDIPQ